MHDFFAMDGFERKRGITGIVTDSSSIHRDR